MTEIRLTVDILISCILQASVNINIQSLESKSTPLHMAIKSSRWSVVECLVGWGALLNVVDRDGNTPLHTVNKLMSVNSPGSPQIEQVKCVLVFSFFLHL